MVRVAGLLFVTVLFAVLFIGGAAVAMGPGLEIPAVQAQPAAGQPPGPQPQGDPAIQLAGPPSGPPSGALSGAPDGTFCRVGVDLYKRLLVQEFDLHALNAGWYVDYYGPGTAHASGMDYAPVLSLQQVGDTGYRLDRSLSKVDTMLAANPGAIWLIGNEPDRAVMQDDLLPQIYAAAYHDLYYYIKQRDPSAQVVAGSIVQASPLRLQYLDLVLDAYRMRYGAPLPADGWSIHGYLLNERSCAAFPDDCWGAEIPPGITATEGLVLDLHDGARLDLFAAQIERFRRWMADRGYRDLPFYVTEFGVLLPPSVGYPPKTVSRFMEGAFDYMLAAKDERLGYARDGNRLVQRFAWYATLTPNANGALFESVNASTPISPPFTLSTIGLGYQDYTLDLTPTVDIAIGDSALAPPFPLAPGGVVGAGSEFTATLVLTVTNAGNLTEETDVLISLYDGEADSAADSLVGGTGELLAPAQTIALSGCGGAQSVQFHWRSPPQGARNGFLTAVVNWAGGSTTQRLAYFVPQHFAYVPAVTK